MLLYMSAKDAVLVNQNLVTVYLSLSESGKFFSALYSDATHSNGASGCDKSKANGDSPNISLWFR